MFKIKNEYSCCKYDVSFLDILEPFVELSKDILTSSDVSLIDIIDFSTIDIEFYQQIERNIADRKRLKKEISKKRKTNITLKKDELRKREEEYKRFISQSSTIFSDYMNSKSFDDTNLETIKNSSILFILKSNNIFVSSTDRNLGVIQNILSKFGVINNFQKKIKGELLRTATANFKKFDKTSFYQSCGWITVDKKDIVCCPIIDFDFIDSDLIESDFCEKNDLWVNIQQIKKQFEIELRFDSYELIKSKETNELLGFRIDNYFFSTVLDVKSLIRKDRIVEFYWLLIKRDVYRQQPLNIKPLSEKIENFNIATKQEEFINLLSYLKKNLYLQDIEIDIQYEPFFDSVISVSDLQYVEDFEFYLPNIDTQEKSILGIYKEIKKPNETFYNLIHWINNKDDLKYDHFHKEEPQEKKKKALKALKPEISFYFRSKFFEDYVKSILTTLGLKFTSNYHLLLKDNTLFEIDFLINVGNDIYFVETKTKMSSQYIQAFEKKCDIILNNLIGFEGSIKFLLISAFSDDNCELYKYYIENALSPELNTLRAGLSTKTYCFDIPISSQTDKSIICISEPVYDKLKTLISNKCR